MRNKLDGYERDVKNACAKKDQNRVNSRRSKRGKKKPSENSATRCEKCALDTSARWPRKRETRRNGSGRRRDWKTRRKPPGVVF